MNREDPLTIPYRDHPRVDELIDRLRYTLEHISLGFDRYGEHRVVGPGMYFAVVIGPSVRTFADQMGHNRWPADQPRDAFESEEHFVQAASEVAYTCDGAVVVSIDGIANFQLVRFRMVNISADLHYAPWMGARHMSALDISTRSNVVATLTLSEESGRVSVFENGAYESWQRSEFGNRWGG